jgi:class 3 adenylate cyclase
MTTGATGATATVVAGKLLGATGAAVTEAGRAAALCAPNSVGFHQTTRNATARPTTTALTKKLTRTREFCN